MIHPSYVDLMKVVNKGVEEGETPVINSRYAVDELNQGEIRILAEDEAEEEFPEPVLEAGSADMISAEESADTEEASAEEADAEDAEEEDEAADGEELIADEEAEE